MVNGTEYGEVRQYGNFSFLRIYEAGHEVPYYQPAASLEFFRRVLANKAVADGTSNVTGDYDTSGLAHATHTESYVALATQSGVTFGGSYSVPGVGPTSALVGSTTGSATGSVAPASSSSSAGRRVNMFWRQWGR